MASYSDSESAILRGQDGSASNDAGQLDSAGQAILKLLHKAAGKADANSRRALETAQKLSSQLEAAKDRIVGLEAELQLYREKADRAEEWLSKITTEIEDRLVNQPEEKRRLRRGDHKHEFEL
jgi:predicted  nucleic acid-binding Zn-ribbon protein